MDIYHPTSESEPHIAKTERGLASKSPNPIQSIHEAVPYTEDQRDETNHGERRT